MALSKSLWKKQQIPEKCGNKEQDWSANNVLLDFLIIHHTFGPLLQGKQDCNNITIKKSHNPDDL